MEIREHHSLAPDPLTEPEKCSGLRNSFAIISVMGVAIFFCAALSLYIPGVYSSLKSTTEIIWSTDTPDPLALQRGIGPPVFAH